MGRADLVGAGSFSNVSYIRGPSVGHTRGDTGQTGGKGRLGCRQKVGALGLWVVFKTIPESRRPRGQRW